MPADLLSLLNDRMRLPLADRLQRAIERLQGQRLGVLQFFGQAKEVVDDLQPWVPIHVLPLGTIRGHRRFGFHVTEKAIAGGALPVVAIWRHRHYPPNLIEHADDLADFVLRALVDLEIDGPEDVLEPAIALAASAFDDDFHQRGRFDVAGARDGGEILARLGRGPVEHYHEAFIWAEDEEDAVQRRLLEEGIERHPDCLHLHALMTRFCDQQGDLPAAARHAAASLACYHHTSLHETIDLDEHYARCASVARRTEDEIASAILERVELRAAGDRARMQHTMSLFTGGDLRAAERTLADMCWDFQDYSNELIVKVMRRQYEELGWAWAQALCDLRALVV